MSIEIDDRAHTQDLEKPIMVDDWVVAGEGAMVDGRVAEADKGGRLRRGAGAAMRGDAAEIPAETVMAFELRSPVTIRERR